MRSNIRYCECFFCSRCGYLLHKTVWVRLSSAIAGGAIPSPTDKQISKRQYHSTSVWYCLYLNFRSVFSWCHSDDCLKISVKAPQRAISALIGAFQRRFICIPQSITRLANPISIHIWQKRYFRCFRKISGQIWAIVPQCVTHCRQITFFIIIFFHKIKHLSKQSILCVFLFYVLGLFVKRSAR